MFSILIGCSNKETFNYKRDSPEWLKAKIDSVTTTNPKYYGAMKVFRYEWKEQYIYHFWIPASSCAYCEVYDQNGLKIQLTEDTERTDFQNNKSNKVLVWDWFSYYK
ncbi:MAG: hypothetical protein HXY48_09060 [Ignavibacteriaceae bacterium]|nr:hypothetical protein [Ignavibacteriaceae bacterium]